MKKNVKYFFAFLLMSIVIVGCNLIGNKSEKFIGTWEELGKRPYASVASNQLIISKSGNNFIIQLMGFYPTGNDEKKFSASYNKENDKLEINSMVDIIYISDNQHILMGQGREWQKIK